MDKKKNFYIFLDIDGVLWDWDWRLKAIDKGQIKNLHFISDFNPKSVQALNFLIEKLKEENDVKLVISSTWRNNLEFTSEIFKNHNLNYDGELLATKLSDHREKRGLEILDFLKTHEKGDFVIIDDEYCDLKNHFSTDKIIKTAIFDNSLSQKHIDAWLKTYQSNNTPAEKGE